MNKTNKSYTCTRINKIRNEACDSVIDGCEPCQAKFLNAAIVAGSVKLRHYSEIVAAAKKKLTGGCYHSDDLEYSEIFKIPTDFTRAVKEWEKRKKETESVRQKIQEFAEKLKDLVWLDEYEKGTVAIKDMEDFVKETIDKFNKKSK